LDRQPADSDSILIEHNDGTVFEILCHGIEVEYQ